MNNRNILTVNEAVQRSRVENIPIAETALRRWIKDGTLHVTYAGRKALIYWPNLVSLLCGETVHSNEQNQERCISQQICALMERVQQIDTQNNREKDVHNADFANRG